MTTCGVRPEDVTLIFVRMLLVKDPERHQASSDTFFVIHLATHVSLAGHEEGLTVAF